MISKYLKVRCKDLISWMKKIRLTKEVAIFKNCCFLFWNFLMKIISQNHLLICDKIVATECVNWPFPNLILFKFFYFSENLETVCLSTDWISFQNSKSLFPIILWIFDLECHSQVSLKIVFVKFDHIFMKFRKLKSLQMENKKLDCHKT